jgi:hypothetical protein
MSTDNARIVVRNRQVELKLTFQYADHILQNFMNHNPPHDVAFLETQKIAKKCVYKHQYKRIWMGEALYKNKMYRVIIILAPKFAVIKTCYYCKYAY